MVQLKRTRDENLRVEYAMIIGTFTALRCIYTGRETTRSDVKQPEFDVIGKLQKFQPVATFTSGSLTSLKRKLLMSGWPILSN